MCARELPVACQGALTAARVELHWFGQVCRPLVWRF
jgi:hypothetical protein